MELDLLVGREERLVRQLEKGIAQSRGSLFAFVGNTSALVYIAAVQSFNLWKAQRIKRKIELYAQEALGADHAAIDVAGVREAYNLYYEEFLRLEMSCIETIADLRRTKQIARQNLRKTTFGWLLPLPLFIGWIVGRQVQFHDMIANLRLITANVLSKIEPPQQAYNSVSDMVDAIRSAHGA